MVDESWCSSKSSATSAHSSAGRGTIAKQKANPKQQLELRAVLNQELASVLNRLTVWRHGLDSRPSPASPPSRREHQADSQDQPHRMMNIETKKASVERHCSVTAVLKIISLLLVALRCRTHPCAISWQCVGPEMQSQPTRAERAIPTVWVLG